MTCQLISKMNLFVTFLCFLSCQKYGTKQVIRLLTQATWAPSAGEDDQLQRTASSVVFNPKKDFQSDKCNIYIYFERKSLNCTHSSINHISQDIDISSYTFLPRLHNRTRHKHSVLVFFSHKTAALWLKAPLVIDHHAHTQATACFFLHDKRSDAVLRILPALYVTKLCSLRCMTVSNARQ